MWIKVINVLEKLQSDKTTTTVYERKVFTIWTRGGKTSVIRLSPLAEPTTAHAEMHEREERYSMTDWLCLCFDSSHRCPYISEALVESELSHPGSSTLTKSLKLSTSHNLSPTGYHSLSSTPIISHPFLSTLTVSHARFILPAKFYQLKPSMSCTNLLSVFVGLWQQREGRCNLTKFFHSARWRFEDPTSNLWA